MISFTTLYDKILSQVGRPLIMLLIGLSTLTGISQARGPEEPFDYSVLKRIPVFNDDRTKPLDTLARESMRLVTSREHWSEKKAAQAGNKWLARDPMTNLLSMVFEADKWQSIPAIHLKDAKVKELIGRASCRERVSIDV